MIERSYNDGLVVDVIYDDGNMEQVTLDHVRWRGLSTSVDMTPESGRYLCELWQADLWEGRLWQQYSP